MNIEQIKKYLEESDSRTWVNINIMLTEEQVKQKLLDSYLFPEEYLKKYAPGLLAWTDKPIKWAKEAARDRNKRNKQK